MSAIGQLDDKQSSKADCRLPIAVLHSRQRQATMTVLPIPTRGAVLPGR
jgi:hypothetical protein